MTVKIGIANPPVGTAVWMPLIVKNTIPYYPTNYGTLSFSESWETSVSGLVDVVRAIVYDANNNLIDGRNVYNFTLIDGQAYTFDWATSTLVITTKQVPWGWIAAGIGALLGLVVAIKSRKGK